MGTGRGGELWRRHHQSPVVHTVGLQGFVEVAEPLEGKCSGKIS